MRRLLKGGLALLALTALAPASRVSAHAQLDSSDPAPSSILEEAPTRITLDFNEPVQTQARSIDIYSADGSRVMIGEALVSQDDPTVVYAENIPPIPDGVYAVAYRVISDDGHVAEGAYTFQIGTVVDAIDSTSLIANALAGRTGPPALSWVMAVARFVGFLGVAVLLGALVMAAGGGISSRSVVGLITGSWAASFVGAAALFMLQGVYVQAGEYSDMFDTSLWRTTFDERIGTALVVRLVLLVAMAGYLVALRGAFSRTATTWWRSSTALIGAGIVVSFAAAGHPSTSSSSGLAVAIDAVHFAAVCLWLGGLVTMVVGRATRGEAATTVIPRFSRLATIAIPVVVATGVWQVWHLVDDLGDVTVTDWGRALLVKTSVVVVVVTLGGFGRWLLHRGQATDMARRLAVEAGLAIAVLGVTAAMVSKPPEVAATPNVFDKALVEADYIAAVVMSPGRVGNNEIHVTITPPGGSLTEMNDVVVRLTLPGSELPTVTVLMTRVGVNHYSGTVAVLYSGAWTLEVVVSPDPSSSILFSTVVDIK